MPSSPENHEHDDRPGTPPRPPYSPVTPVLSHLAPTNISATLNGASQSQAHPIAPPAKSPSPTTPAPPNASLSSFPGVLGPVVFGQEPAPVPISESENPDAIALRSAISVLQLQKQQSIRDIQALEKLKKVAVADPEAFARELAAGNLAVAKDQGGFVNFTHNDSAASRNGSDGSMKEVLADIGPIPAPQNVVRMPPVNWAKYQVVGESLDRMHEDQLRRPSPGEPRRQDPTQRAPEHVIASPYRPLVDKLESPTQVKGGSKNKKI
ncbi:uncharacterized protein ACLA_072660 [Aspergillus clavatus NRRL 1]|uniref:Uncharacterized protein n=1 Tax=Aspergillus clavatus (strain ATCC 1007 / CBS 513.65 / DSM 816 / NCTC 3887 / NRRL 1 / QM 1276 / 107) TaxID=344612 RepID=A1C762_ASPCL|nr:uncharacterized protein ACLA_072660 [Aspergillus clavatus NRRL 1]EAW14233.1 conserved hypothetical protein [Aspergillus clavatus NRRL 1]